MAETPPINQILAALSRQYKSFKLANSMKPIYVEGLMLYVLALARRAAVKKVLVMTEIEKQAEIKMLRQLLAGSTKRLEELNAERHREELWNSSLQATLRLREGTSNDNGSNEEERNQDNTSPVPQRKAEFSSITILLAIKQVLESFQPEREFTHVDDLIKEIYEPITDNERLYRVKRTLVSELIRGIKKNMFRRGPGPNTFGLPGQENHMAA